MQSDLTGPSAGIQPRPLAELLQCPPETSKLLHGAAFCMNADSGEYVFRQADECRGLYVVLSGVLQKRTERLDTRVVLGLARVGDLVELAAVLGNGQHTYTLAAQIPATVLLIPLEGLRQAFEDHPPLRMRLLEELAREVSRSYSVSCQNRAPKQRRNGGASQQA